MGNSSAFGSLARKALVYGIVAIVAIMLLKIVVGVVVGFVSMIFGLALLALVGFAVLWTVRRL